MLGLRLLRLGAIMAQLYLALTTSDSMLLLSTLRVARAAAGSASPSAA